MGCSKGTDAINYEAVICNRCLESLQAIPGHATDHITINESPCKHDERTYFWSTILVLGHYKDKIK